MIECYGVIWSDRLIRSDEVILWSCEVICNDE